MKVVKSFVRPCNVKPLSFVSAGLTLIALATLAGCGGGGGGGATPVAPAPPPVAGPAPAPAPGPAPPPTSAPTARILSANQAPVIPINAGTTTTAVQVDVPAGASTANLVVQSPSGSVTVAATSTVMVPVAGTSGQAIRLTQNGNTLGSEVVVTPVCAPASSWSVAETKCLASRLTYQPFVLALTGGTAGVPVLIKGETCATVTVKLVENATRFQTKPGINVPLFNTRLVLTPTPAGYIWVAQQVVDNNNDFGFFLYDPQADKLIDNDGRQGNPPVFTDDIWQRVSVSNHPDPIIGKHAMTDKLFVYVTRVEGNTPYCENLVNGVRAGSATRVPLPITPAMQTFGGFFPFRN